MQPSAGSPSVAPETPRCHAGSRGTIWECFPFDISTTLSSPTLWTTFIHVCPENVSGVWWRGFSLIVVVYTAKNINRGWQMIDINCGTDSRAGCVQNLGRTQNEM